MPVKKKKIKPDLEKEQPIQKPVSDTQLEFNNKLIDTIKLLTDRIERIEFKMNKMAHRLGL